MLSRQGWAVESSVEGVYRQGVKSKWEKDQDEDEASRWTSVLVSEHAVRPWAGR